MDVAARSSSSADAGSGGQRHVDQREQRRIHTRPVDRVQPGDQGRELPIVRPGIHDRPSEPGRGDFRGHPVLARPYDYDGVGKPGLAQGVQNPADKRPIAGPKERFRAPHTGGGPRREDNGDRHAGRSYTRGCGAARRGEFVDFGVGFSLHWRRFKLSVEPSGCSRG